MISIPLPSATMTLTMHDDEVIIVRRHGNPHGPRILFSHGNGLAADLYYPLWSGLTNRFDLFIYDIRNHGWNPVGDRLHHNIPNFVRDSRLIVESIGARFGPKPLIGVFHSLSAVVSLLHQEEADGFAALVLFDPPINHLAHPESYLYKLGDSVAQRARNRQAHFDSRAEFAENIRRSRAFRSVLPEVADLIAQTTLRSTHSGFELRCPPEYEAQIYEYLFAWRPETYVVRNCPVKVIGSDPTTPFSFMPALDLSTMIQINYDFVPESTHFLPLEYPAVCINTMLAFLEGNDLLEQWD